MMRRDISLVKDPNLFTAKSKLEVPIKLRIITSFKRKTFDYIFQSIGFECKPETQKI